MDDNAILALYRARSEEAIAATDAKYGAYCRRISRSILHSDEDAAECVNDTWLAAWNAIPPQRPINFQGFLGKIVRNLSLNRREKYAAQKRAGDQTSLALSELGECVPAAGGGVDDALALTEALNAFLRALSADDRTLFLRRYWYLCPIRELAALTGATESRTASRLHRLRGKLKQHLEQEGITL